MGSFSRFQVPRYGKALFLAPDLRHMEPARCLASVLRPGRLVYGAMWICWVDVWGCVVELVEEMSASDKLVWRIFERKLSRRMLDLV